MTDTQSEPVLVEPDLPDHGREPSGRGSIITLTTVIALLLATGFTVLGLGATDHAVANFDASVWLWSSNRGEVDRVNGLTARVDTRTKIKDAQNHDIQITQTDKYLILRDLDTGEVSALDLTTLQISAVMPTTPGLGVSVALHGDDAFVIDSVQGQVRQLDPRSLAPVGDSITLPNGIEPGGFDGAGSLWIAVPTEGTVVAIRPGANGASPSIVRTVTVTTPGHDLVLSTLDEGVAVLDNTDQNLVTVKADKIVGKLAVPIDQPGTMPARTTGPTIPITVPSDRKVVVVNGTKVNQYTVPGTGDVAPAVSFAGRIYCADAAAGTVYEFDAGGKVVKQIPIPSAGGPLELEVRESHLFINAPDGSTARVIDDKHVVKDVNKYEDGVLGGDPPPPPPQTQDPKPTKSVPGKPQNVTASAGDASAVLSWRKAPENGSAITKYVVEGHGGAPITVGARQRSVQLTGLTNGKTYKFTVYAVNALGNGPKATSPSVMPTADVPDAPTGATAVAKADGTVDVTWPAANGQGRRIISYNVTSISGGTQAPVGSVTGTRMTIARGSLTYGTQYAFFVVAINDRNAGSDPSPTSNTVVPFAAPGAPRNTAATTVANQKGAVRVTWQAALDNGRPIEKYVVDGGNGPQDVTGTSVTLNGFADDTAVQVTVHAVNEAGAGPDATASARTIGVPSLTVTASSAGYNSVSVTMTPNNKNGAATCRVHINGATDATGGCTTAPVTLTVNGLWPNNTYTFTASITTAAGTDSANGTRATNSIRFTVVCRSTDNYCGGGIWPYRTPTQQGTGAPPALFNGNTGTPLCHATGNVNVNATPWGGKNTNQWVQFTHQGRTAYIPWAWVRLDGGDNLNSIPGC